MQCKLYTLIEKNGSQALMFAVCSMSKRLHIHFVPFRENVILNPSQILLSLNYL